MLLLTSNDVHPAGILIASLLPLPSAKLLGVDSAEAQVSESESSSGSAADISADSDDAAAARYAELHCNQESHY